jgi:hypothetical protein
MPSPWWWQRHVAPTSPSPLYFQGRTFPCKGDLFLVAIRHHCLSDQLATSIGINQEDRKGEQCSRLLNGCQHRFLTPREEGKTFRPSDCHVGEWEACTGSLPRCRCHNGRARSAGSQAGSGLLPLLEGTNRNLLFEQRSRSCGGEAMLTSCALGTQELIG